MEQQGENVVSPANIIIPPVVPNVMLQSIPPMPLLGPAPIQLPPLINPPPPIQIVTNQSIPEPQLEPVVPVQAQFETLNLNSPSASVPQPVNNEFSTLPPPLPLSDGDSTASPPLDTNGESSVVPEEEGKSGT